MTVDSQLRRHVRRLEGPHGAMNERDRFVAMSRKWAGITHAAAYDTQPQSADLLALAAHCVVWAKELDADRSTTP